MGQLTGVQIELLTRSHDARHDLTARLAKVLLRLDGATTMKRVLVDDPGLPELALRVSGVVHEISADMGEAELLELLSDKT